MNKTRCRIAPSRLCAHRLLDYFLFGDYSATIGDKYARLNEVRRKDRHNLVVRLQRARSRRVLSYDRQRFIKNHRTTDKIQRPPGLIDLAVRVDLRNIPK